MNLTNETAFNQKFIGLSDKILTKSAKREAEDILRDMDTEQREEDKEYFAFWYMTFSDIYTFVANTMMNNDVTNPGLARSRWALHLIKEKVGVDGLKRGMNNVNELLKDR